MVKEHLIGLSLDKGIQAQFDKIETKVKSQFTREYNKQHTAIKITGRSKGSKKEADETKSHESEQEESEGEEEEQDVLLDEE